ncbi:DNA mismatch repair endonuclease MutL [Lentilactobacillus laojiaonis]|uniref:DNA mismatch repair endonuclease MutL n=1 Tax=Lentilactobacillus laojiaonis TaxID=2883998 RepID=UPI001D0B3150|nr:DNA mismatch repair endonuclease MutL [Lentilactobacillus laojiaonis]UDM31714.1 DNA mismatch repair endonuclease MutL [Lentilactobacillus laojiaonis]
MPKIHELSTNLANQIAAGEVIERPASVVKELVENSIDAHSTEIDISVIDAGIKSIEVIDDGDGIEKTDVKTAFLRHATSKITRQKDLFRVNTLGFRGEALPSISSIADVTLKTSTGEMGTKVRFKGGKLIEETSSESKKGTSIIVNSIFYNTPARLKYLKSQKTELSKITDVVHHLALSHPEITFTLNSDGKELLRTSGRNNPLQVIGSIYGIKAVSQMTKFENLQNDITVSGFFSLPELTRSSRNYISIFLNGRYIKNFQLTRAVISGYGSKLMVGRFPLAIISIEIDPRLVDVNVHPTKQEVRISEENLLSNLISNGISEALAKAVLIPEVDEKFIPRETNFAKASDEKNVELIKTQPLAKKLTDLNRIVEDNDPIIIKSKLDLNSEEIQNFDKKVLENSANLNYEDLIEPESPQIEQIQLSTKVNNHFPQLNYIGQFHGTYLLTESSEGLYLIDQHAAQERINYEYYREEIGKVEPTQQKLLLPIILDYSISDFLLISEKMDLLKKVGLYLEPFGQSSFLVRSHPTWFKAGQEEDTLKEMIDYIINEKNISIATFREKTAIMMSCKRAIKANHHLDDQQARELLTRLPNCENPYNCPHGRPVLVKFTNEDVEKMFKRIQDSHDTISSII